MNPTKKYFHKLIKMAAQAGYTPDPERWLSASFTLTHWPKLRKYWLTRAKQTQDPSMLNVATILDEIYLNPCKTPLEPKDDP